MASGVIILRAVALYTVPVGICEVACVPAAGVPFKVTGDLWGWDGVGGVSTTVHPLPSCPNTGLEVG